MNLRLNNIKNVDNAIWQAQLYLQQLKETNADPKVITAVEKVLKPIMAARETMEGISDAAIDLAEKL